jgi:hypothetical protein
MSSAEVFSLLGAIGDRIVDAARVLQVELLPEEAAVAWALLADT